MSMTISTEKCPRCKGDMIAVTDGYSYEQNCQCDCCGLTQQWRYNYQDKLLQLRKEERPTAYIFLLFRHGVQNFAYYGKHPYKWLKDWKHNVSAMNDVIMSESYGVVYNKRRRKLETIFGAKSAICSNSYHN